MIVEIVSVLGMLSSVSGNLLLAKKSALGFWCFLAGNLMWILYSILFSFNLPMVIQYLIFSVINVYGIYEYRKGEKTRCNSKK